jgi:hypothetical protein
MPGPFPYNDTPKANQKINATQPLIQENFSSINDEFSVNHVGINVASAGKHKMVQLLQQAASSSTGSTEVALYAKNYTETSQTELFYRPKSNGTEVPFTAANKSSTGWSYLPSGLLMKWGTATSGGTATAPISLDPIGPNYTQVPFVISLASKAPAATAEAISYFEEFASSFKVRTEIGNVTFKWFTIGI